MAEFHEKALPAVPALQRALADPKFETRRYITNALLQIAPEVLTNTPAQ
ncbi:MAG TPA: hypothetical protein VNT26_18440 [Candidatus Sulfotelmatobacter sp.]|nr:hypothetical protein [Candidatus Sulfotelmatobacter sp.]